VLETKKGDGSKSVFYTQHGWSYALTVTEFTQTVYRLFIVYIFQQAPTTSFIRENLQCKKID
jgi:hypothetical protein